MFILTKSHWRKPIIMNSKVHRSIRSYRPQPIPKELLTKILQRAIQASNTGNFQSYSLIVTQDPEKKKALAPLHYNQPMVTQAPVLLTFCVDYNRIAHWCIESGTSCGHLNLMGFLNASLDTMLFAQNVAVIAEEHDLGICFLGTVLYNLEAMIRALELPKGVVPLLAMSMGYPAEDPEPRVRLPLEAIVHYETYSEPTTEQIQKNYAPIITNPFYTEQVARTGAKSLAHLIMEQQYPQATYEKLSREILRVLQLQGFEIAQ